jgi:dTDP-4-amino-4,6-dideoxygalactose transaminase
MRSQPPAYSPIAGKSLVAGLAAAVGAWRPKERLKERISNTYDCRTAVLTDSGRSALRLAIESARGMSESNVVAIPAYCCFDVATAVANLDIQVVLFDIDPGTLGPDWESLRTALAAGARTVVVAHLYGVPVDLDAVRELCQQFGALCIEDAAQGAGGFWGRDPLGAIGDLGVLSFGRGKGRTGGGGGALLANTELGEQALSRIHGCIGRGRRGWRSWFTLVAQWCFGRPPFYGIPASLPFLELGETRYRDPHEPCEIAAAEAGAVLFNWASSEEEAARRRGLIRTLEECTEYTHAAFEKSTNPKAIAGWLRYPLVIKARDTHMEDLRIWGVADGYPHSLDWLEVIQQKLVHEGNLPGAQRLAEGLVTLPTHRYQRVGRLKRLRDFVLTPVPTQGAPKSP